MTLIDRYILEVAQTPGTDFDRWILLYRAIEQLTAEKDKYLDRLKEVPKTSTEEKR